MDPQTSTPTGPKAPTSREQRKRECREAIARAAVELFERKGFEATTMDEIAHAAGVSRPTVFNYFSRKEDILAALGDMMSVRFEADLLAARERAGDDPLEAIRSIVVSMAAAFERSGAACVGRPQPLDVTGAGPLQRAIAAARASRLGHHPASFIYAASEGFVPPQSVAVAYRRTVFDRLGEERVHSASGAARRQSVVHEEHFSRRVEGGNGFPVPSTHA